MLDGECRVQGPVRIGETDGIELHARAPTLVELSHHQARFLLTVTDPDPGSEPQVAGPRPPGPGGFGLRIVSSLAQHVGWYRTDDAKVVWAEVGE